MIVEINGITYKPLNKRQELFCEYVSSGMIPYRAAIKAGYSEKSAGNSSVDNMRNPLVQARIKELSAEVSKELNITRESQLKDLEKVKELSLGKKDYKTFVTAIAEQNRMLGLHEAEKKDVSVTGVQLVVKDLEQAALIDSLKEETKV